MYSSTQIHHAPGHPLQSDPLEYFAALQNLLPHHLENYFREALERIPQSLVFSSHGRNDTDDYISSCTMLSTIPVQSSCPLITIMHVYPRDGAA